MEERKTDDDVRAVPIGLWYVAAVLRERGHHVEVLNAFDYRGEPERFAGVVNGWRPDLVGFSVLNANRWGALDMAHVAKEANPDLPVVFGGPGATFLWEHFLTHFPEVDYVVLGEAENAMADLAAGIAAGSVAPDSPNVAMRRDGVPVSNPCLPDVRDLDSLPDPALHFTFRHVALSRGCPSACTFCGSPRFWRRRVRRHSPGYFVNQLKTLAEKGVRHFHVSDDTFTLDRDAVLEVCDGILSEGLDITWCAISRVDRVDDGVIRAMRRAGCIQISYGVEHGDPDMRRFLGKRQTDEDIEKAFAATASHGVLPRAYFIYGCPGENEQSVGATIRLMHRIRPLSTVFYMLDLFPGTALYDQYRRRENVSDDIWFDRREDIAWCETDPDLPCERVVEIGERLRREFARHLPGYVDALVLVDDPGLYPLHADFLSRLAMTFDHGDYAANPDVSDPGAVAENLYERALAWHPVARAYLGMGVRRQRQGRHEESVEILDRGLREFPDDEALNVCMGVALLNTGKPGPALDHLSRFPENPDAVRFAMHAHEALGEVEKARECRVKLDRLTGRIG